MELDYFKQLLQNKNLDLSYFQSLYEEKKFDLIFKLAIIHDIPDLVSYLYKNLELKFYISNYIDNMDKNLFDELNKNMSCNNCYKIFYKNNNNQSLNELNYLKRFSKLNKDNNGFYYVFNKKYLNN